MLRPTLSASLLTLAGLLALTACAKPEGPRPMPLVLDEAPFVLTDSGGREELTLRPDRSLYILRSIPFGHGPVLKSGHYDIVAGTRQIVLLDFTTPVRIAFAPNAEEPLLFERVRLVPFSTIPPQALDQYTLMTGQYYAPNAVLAPREGEVAITPLLPPGR